MLSVNEAKRIVINNAKALGRVKLPLLDSVGFALGEDIRANTNLPAFDNSAMDGFALAASDTKFASLKQPVFLKVIGESVAGSPFKGRVKKGSAVRIMTGAVLPSGADSIVMQEEVVQHRDFIEVTRPINKGEHTRLCGEDIKRKCLAVKKYTILTPQHLGVLSALGRRFVKVFRGPRISVMATGSELVSAQQRLSAGKLRNSNTPVLLGLLKAAGIEAKDLGIIKDNRKTLSCAIREAIASSDLIIICGGVSVGKYDLVKDALSKEGFKSLFWKVRIKPGKPLLFGKIAKRLLFGLPGNPVSCVLCFIEFVLPAIRRMMAKEPYFNRRIQAVLKKPISKKDRRTHYITAFLEHTPKGAFVTPTTTQGSGMLTSLAGANSFIVMDEDTIGVSAGSKVEAILF